LEEVGITSKKVQNFNYADIGGLAWDHANSEVKITLKMDDNFVILTMANSIEFEGEIKLRLSAAAATNGQMKMPSPMYIGMFAGATKPKPFQRKRPNVSHLPSGKLPTLNEMRTMALDLHRGSYRPCPNGESRRMEIALQHIYEGFNTFQLLNVRGAPEFSNQYRGSESSFIVTDEAILFKPRGANSDMKLDIPYEDIAEWNVVDNDSYRSSDSGIEIVLQSNETVFFGFAHVRDVKHTLEYFWNCYKVNNGQSDSVKLGSTHGRPIVSLQTLSGDIPPPDQGPVGQTDVVDQDGILVRPGGKMAPRRTSIAAGVINTSKEPKIVPSENREVKKHWHKVVMHQGWLLKQGGVGVGSNKGWIKRYFVLYKTSQGHFLVYYSDFTECPMYTSEKNHRNIVDLAKATFIRPGSNKADNPDTPPYSFDIVTTEREWTLCAESQDNMQKWLQLITRAVDEDVAILPDEELVFKVKPKLDPLQVLPATDYSTTLKVSAFGVSVSAPDTGKEAGDKEFYFWVYTDFYKWSLMCPDGKFALLVNVFADSSFSRRYEYVFRTKEAHRLATAIEYFIEKFMSVMHIRMETQEGAFDQVADHDHHADRDEKNTAGGAGNKGGGKAGSGLHVLAPEDNQGGYGGDEIDLLGLEVESSPLANRVTGRNASSQDSSVFRSNPFESGSNDNNQFNPSDTTTPASSSAHQSYNNKQSNSNNYNNKPAFTDLLGMDDDTTPVVPPPAPATAPPTGPPSSSVSTNLFSDDPFGSSGDPFASFSIGSGGNAGNTAAGPKIAPPLSAHQQEQHRRWFVQALGETAGPIYDDGTLSVISKVEVRGSQCRLSLQYSNQSPASLTAVNCQIIDSAGLLRFEAGTLPSTIGGLGKESQVIMVECMKPAAPGPQLKIEYIDSFQGKRSNSVPLPLFVASFNEPLSLSAEDFQSRWQQLVSPGQEAQQVFRPTNPIVLSEIQSSFSAVSSFILLLVLV
jgi:hypothetical protein